MANEKRLIDANEAYEIARTSRLHDDFGRCMADLTSLKELLEDCPTVDAVEVVHGRWEDAYDGNYANPLYRCSVCKEIALFKWERDVLGNYRGVQALTPHCPYCMARLDGGKANDI